MGHRYTPEECRGAGPLCGADGGPAGALAECVESSASEAQQSGRTSDPVGMSSARPNSRSVCRADDGTRDRPGLGVVAALFALCLYKTYLSLLFAGNCRFEPSCSRYSYQAIERFGVTRGSWLTLRRLLCCQPLSGKFGYDPVPDTWDEASICARPGVRGRTVPANEAHS
jgi:uncharacterized protein